MGNIVTAGPNEVVVISGGCVGKAPNKFIVDGRAWKWWMADSMRMSLEVSPVYPQVYNCTTKNGVPLNMQASVQVRVGTEPSHLPRACGEFLGRKPYEIEEVVRKIFEGHIRKTCEDWESEQISKDRESFTKTVMCEAVEDLMAVGLKIVCHLTLLDLSDNNRNI